MFRLRIAVASGLAIAASTAGACGRRVPVVERDVNVGPVPVALRFERPFHAEGPTRELCLDLATASDAQALAPDGSSTRHTPALAVLVRASGRRDTLGYFDEGPSRLFGSGRWTGPAVDVRDATTVCLWDHGLTNPANAALVRYTYDSAGRVVGSAPPEHPLPPLTAVYTGVELQSASPVRVRTASLWTGQRMASP